MICLLSPAKTMISASDLKESSLICPPTTPQLIDQSRTLASLLKTKSKKDLKSLCDVSDNLATHVASIYKNYSLQGGDNLDDLELDRFSQSALAFNGPAFQGLSASTLSPEQGGLLQNHLRILTGLYGPVRPGDMIQEHRLCMSTKLAVDKAHKDLYSFWGNSIATNILNDIERQLDSIEKLTGHRPPPVIVNCASQEYYKAVSPFLEANGIMIIECVFLDGGMIKSAFAKRARGLMARYVCTHGGISSALDVDHLKNFSSEGYKFSQTQSSDKRLVFNRASPPPKAKKSTVKTYVPPRSEDSVPEKKVGRKRNTKSDPSSTEEDATTSTRVTRKRSRRT